MTNIYMNAARVLIWLGDRPEDVDALRQCQSILREETALALGQSEATKAQIEDRRTRITLGLTYLAQMPWFSRRWVIQEVALNSNVGLCCGRVELPWQKTIKLLHSVPMTDDAMPNVALL